MLKLKLFHISVLVFLGSASFIPSISQTDPDKIISGYFQLPEYNPEEITYRDDWLIKKPDFQSALFRKADQCLVLSNGLISRTFTLAPDGATVGLDLLTNNKSFFRALKPEAIIVLDGDTITVGGLKGQPVMNYFKDEWIHNLIPVESSMRLVKVITNPIMARFGWQKHLDWMPRDLPWPPKGLELMMTYRFQSNQKTSLIKHFGKDNFTKLSELEVMVHYEMYDDVPLISKWITIKNNGTEGIRIDHFQSEILAFIEPQSSVGDLDNWMKPDISIETDYAFGGSMNQESGVNKSYAWKADPEYQTVINYSRIHPTMLVVEPGIGPGVMLDPGEKFDSYRVFELMLDSDNRERKGFALRKMYRTIAPWITENPILMHVRRADDKSVKLAIDQCADVGFEMVIMTFGSGFNVEDSSQKNIDRMKELADYAHRKGIALGGYSLLASRSIDDQNDVIMPEGMRPRFNNSPCLQSNWGKKYFQNLYDFYKQTGMDILEHDGSYPGDPCLSTEHPGHIGWDDSQWEQFRLIADFYQWCRANGIYLNVPDWYFLNGSTKTAMGYRETNWSLPREFQEIIERQNVYDGTWEKTPSMGWMFVPLVQYHGGGKAATIEPLKDHLNHYEQRLANLFGNGVQACYRGPRLYDAPETQEIVKKWVDFYKKHRQILDADVIHLRRPDGRDWDGLLHVDPEGDEKGLIMLYNPLSEKIHKTIEVDLYYTGLQDEIMISREDGPYEKKILEDKTKIQLQIDIPARGWTWMVLN
ncbi:hypothetical protein ACFLU5_14690 [Bacteroidota bacterium]